MAYSRILIPTDFSDISAAVLQHARTLADTFGSSLHVLHVVEDPVMGVGLEECYSRGSRSVPA